MLRQVSAAGGFATVLAKGEADSGTILIVLVENGQNSRLYERMPSLAGDRLWQCTKRENPESRGEFAEYLEKRRDQDGDLWIIELDILHGERFIGIATAGG